MPTFAEQAFLLCHPAVVIGGLIKELKVTGRLLIIAKWEQFETQIRKEM